jgi:hypothetical protein
MGIMLRATGVLFKKKVFFPLFLMFFYFMTIPVSAEEGDVKEKEKEFESGKIVVLRAGEWEIDAGGQVRLRGDFAKNQNFTNLSFTPGHDEAQFLERTRLQASVENHDLNLKALVQVQWYGRWGGLDNRSAFDLYQGYVEWEKILGSPVSLKAGRQEFLYGSAFFIGTNDFYNGLTWDGFKGSLNPFEGLTIDVLGSKMVKLNPGDPNIYLAGLYTTYKIFKEGSLEPYLFYNKGGFPFFHKEFSLVDSGQNWYTLGSRFAGKVGGFDFELEPQFQWGEVKAVGDGRDAVRAYGGHIDLGYTFRLPWEPRLFGKYAYGSGDNNPFDGTYREFHGSIFNDDGSLYGDMKVVPDQSGVTVNGIHASGLQIWVVGISIKPLSNLSVTLRAHRFLAVKTPSGFSRDVGTEIDLPISYELTKRISFIVGLNRFYTGRFFRQASGSGKNIDYGYIQAQVEF